MTIELFELPISEFVFEKIKKPDSSNKKVIEKLDSLVRENFNRKERPKKNEPNFVLKQSIILKKNKVVEFILKHFRSLNLDLNMKFENEGGFMDIAYNEKNLIAMKTLMQFGLRRSIFDENEIERIQREQELQKLECLKNCSDFYIEGDDLENVLKNTEMIKSENFSSFALFLDDVDDSDEESLIFSKLWNLILNEPNKFIDEFCTLDQKEKEVFLSERIPLETEWSGGYEEKLTPLQYACVKKDAILAYFLIKHGASVNDFNQTLDLTNVCTNYPLIENINISRSSLHCAIDRGLSLIALLLLQKGAKDRVATCISFYGNSVYSLPNHFKGNAHSEIIHLSGLHMAIIRGMHQVVEYMLKNNLSHLHNKTTGLYTPLHLAVRKKDLKMIKILFDYGGEQLLDKKDRFGLTPIEILLYQEDNDFMEQVYSLINKKNKKTSLGFLTEWTKWLYEGIVEQSKAPI